jgi:hypothetical protein
MASVVLAGASSALALPTQYTTAVNYGDLNVGDSIRDGDKVFSEITCSEKTRIGTTNGGCSGLTFGPLTGDIGLEIQGGLGATGGTYTDSVFEASTLDIIITYRVDADDPNRIVLISQNFNGRFEGDGAGNLAPDNPAGVSSDETVFSGSLDGLIQANSNVSASSDNQDSPDVNEPDPNAFELDSGQDMQLGSPFKTLFVKKDILLTGGCAVAVADGNCQLANTIKTSISFIGQDFRQTTVPEPTTLGVLGVGLLGLGFAAHRRRKAA